MDPQVKLPEAGLCPVCGMDLIPLDDEPSGPRELKMSAEAMALADIRVEPVRRRYVTKLVRMVGKVDYDETRLSDITSWIPNGRLDELYIDYTNTRVRKGDHLFSIYSPDLVIAQRELLLNSRANHTSRGERDSQWRLDSSQLTEAKLRRWGLLDEQIQAIKRRGTPADHVTIRAPIGGVVIRKHANEGVYVKEGAKIYTIADLSQVWVYLDAYESDIPWLSYGQEVEFSTETYPGKTFSGTVALIDPVLNEQTRTSGVRVNVSNEDRKLKPGMFVHATVRSRLAAGGVVLAPSLAGKWISPHHPEVVKDGPGKCDICGVDLVPAEEFGLVSKGKPPQRPLVIPSTAPLITGKRAVVYVRVPTSADLHREMAAVWKAAEHAAGGQRPTFADLARKINAAFANAERMKRRRDAVEIPPPPQKDDQQKEWNFDVLFQLIDNLHHEAAELSNAEQPAVEDVVEVIRTAWKKAGKLSDWERPSFEGREIVLGERVGDYYIVRRGLEEGELVVTSGNFKIDSQLQIQARPSMMSSEALDVPDEFRSELSALYTPYFKLHESLANDRAGDRLQDALEAFSEMRAAVRGVAGEVPEGRAGRAARERDRRVDEAWQKTRMALIRNLTAGAEPSDIKELRKRFVPLSRVMIEMVDTFGHAEQQTLYEAYCPMAFGNKGAGWLQAGREPANPYFPRGAMLKCVEIKRYWRTGADSMGEED